MSTKFKSVAEAAAHLAGDSEVCHRVEGEIRRNELVTALLQMRVSKGLTQEQIADKMNCDPSTVSRIESGSDRHLKWSDIVGYVSALNVQMGIFFDDETMPSATRIKQCVFKIDEDLSKLAELAKQQADDENIVQKIDKFYREVLFEFAVRFGENRGKLDSVTKIIKFPSAQKEVNLLSESCEANVAAATGR